MASDRTLQNLRESLPGSIYIFLKDEDTKTIFLNDAESEGYSFGNYGLPGKLSDDMISLCENRQLAHVGFIGRMAFQCRGGDNTRDVFHRIDYAKYAHGYSDFFYNDISF